MQVSPSGQQKIGKRKEKWTLDLSMRRGEQRNDLPSPPGYLTEKLPAAEVAAANEGSHLDLVDKRSWDIALAPIKGLPMNIFIMYMAGNTISIFPIMMVGMMFFRPIQALMGIRATTRMLERSKQYILQTLVYFLGNCLALGLAVYKCNSMGLLPTYTSDWLAFADPVQSMEHVGGGFTL
uniref:ER membrane protein complex subunit 4 n=1 Tax=Phallusia mammillata TaxID=59560 RepID=A0A6F9DBB2_9ASCI|nr:ER membrane protein complex subunit 4 [Phallusia mammillata]